MSGTSSAPAPSKKPKLSSTTTEDADGDSMMQSSPSATAEDGGVPVVDSDAVATSTTNQPTTPQRESGGTPAFGELSPPDSQRGPSTAVAASSSTLNANGKRALSNSITVTGGEINMGDHGNLEGSAGESQRVHPASGYTWSRDEDAPGWLWQNKKAQDEYARAMELIYGKELMVRNRYGDVLIDDREVPGRKG